MSNFTIDEIDLLLSEWVKSGGDDQGRLEKINQLRDMVENYGRLVVVDSINSGQFDDFVLGVIGRSGEKGAQGARLRDELRRRGLTNDQANHYLRGMGWRRKIMLVKSHSKGGTGRPMTRYHFYKANTPSL